MKTEKSKKDIAFDKERAKYRHEINDLQRTISKQIAEISNLMKRISELEESVRQKDEWIQRLLEYTELSEEDMRKQIKKDKNVSEVLEHINDMNNLIAGFGKRFGL